MDGIKMSTKYKLPADKKREIIEKAVAMTDPKYGIGPPDHRSIEYLLKNGIVLLDKPAGPTSHEVVSWVKRILNLSKAGHSGTLDPGVTGLLPIALENATKILHALLPAGKEYVCLMKVHDEVDPERIREVVAEFVGPIYQKPPLKSSVKKVLRIRKIYYNEILEIEGKYVLMRTGCQAGTYMRKLCHDIGEVLGCGANMQELRRTRVGPFKEDDHLATLQDLLDAYIFWKEDGDEREIRKYLLPIESAVSHLPHIYIRDNAVNAICHGADLAAQGVVKLHDDITKKSTVAIMTLKNELVALGTSLMSSQQILRAKSGIVVKTKRVIMPRNVYPKLWSSKDE